MVLPGPGKPLSLSHLGTVGSFVPDPDGREEAISRYQVSYR